MEIADEQSEEYARIAFLLGSALRNEDSEQFLELYDTVISKDFCPEQVNKLKESARAIADLPDGEYCELLSEPSKFSLIPSDVAAADVHASEALRSVNTTTTSSDSGISSYPISAPVMDLSSDEVAPRPSLEALARTSRHFTASKSPAVEAEDLSPDPRVDDSGVFNSSKNTTSSELEPDSPSAEMEDERVGYFNYFEPSDKKPVPEKKDSTNPELKVSNTKAYDAVFDADAEIVNSDAIELYDVDPPGVYGASAYRAKKKFDDELANMAGTMTEMTTFCRSGGSDSSDNYDEDLVQGAQQAQVRERNAHTQDDNTAQYDEVVSVHSCDDSHNSSLEEVVIDADHKHNTSGDSSDEHLSRQVLEKVNIHQQLYSDSAYTSASQYKYHQLTTSDDEDEGYQLRFSSCGAYSSGRSYGGSEPDGRITFPLSYNRRGRGQLMRADGMSAVQTPTSDRVTVEKSIKSRDMPPFGDPPNFKKIGNSAERLLDFQRSSLEAPNMPTAAPINDKSIKEEEKKKKKRKKKKESGEKGESGQQDENGNPLEDKSASPVGRSHDFKKAIPSQSGGKMDVCNSDSFPYDTGKSRFPPNVLAMESLGFNSMMPDYEDANSMSGSTSETYAKMQGRRAKKEKRLNKEKVLKAEEIPGYMGEKNIDQILFMIEGSNQERGAIPQATNNKKKKALPASSIVSESTPSPPASEISEMSEPATLDKDPLSKGTKKKKRKSGGSKDHEDPEDHEQEPGGEGAEKDSGSVSQEKDSDEYSTGSDQPKDMQSVSKVTANGISDVTALHNANNYIFTDFDEPARVQEAEFVTVAKKKKPSVVKKEQVYVRESYVKPYTRRDFFIPRPPPERGSSVEMALGGEREKERKPLERQANSVSSPPPTPTAPEPQQPGDEAERSFSPSQFPVLSAKPSSRVGRRNSTGSAPTPDVNYDSDMESVKSVPLVTGNGHAPEPGGSASPGSASGPVGISYASIAAGKKPNGPKASSSVSSGGSNQKLTPATPPEVEMGDAKSISAVEGIDITESRPDEQPSVQVISAVETREAIPTREVASTDTTACEATLVLSTEEAGVGAGEAAGGVSEINVSVNLTLPPSGGEEGHDEDEAPCAQCEEESVEYTYKLSETDPHVLECIARPVLPAHSHPDNNKRSHPISVETPVTAGEGAAPSSHQHPRPVTAARPGDSDNSDKFHNHVDSTQHGNFQQASEAGAVTTSKPEGTKAKRAPKLSKSVIFLNEKMNQPTNLGISFGFDEDDMGDFPPLGSNNVQPVMTNCHSGQGDDSGCVSFGGSASPQPKVKSAAPPNGFVFPQVIAAAAAAPSDIISINHMQNPTPAESKLFDSRAMSLSTGNSQEKLPKNKFKFSPPKDYNRHEDPNFDCGHFDRELACSLLYRGWQEIQSLRNNGKAVLYSEIS